MAEGRGEREQLGLLAQGEPPPWAAFSGHAQIHSLQVQTPPLSQEASAQFLMVDTRSREGRRLKPMLSTALARERDASESIWS